MEEAMKGVAANKQNDIERFLSTISIFASISPLLGLLGTVVGMIGTFNVISVFGTGNAKLLSGGISEALITTELGLIIAVPLLLFHSILSAKVNRIYNMFEEYIYETLEIVCPAENVCSADNE
jgi:biopolymer transport protein ExbB